MPPGHGEQVAELAGEASAAGADGRRRVVVDLAALDDGDPFVEQGGEGADESRLALTALAEQHHVVTGEEGPLELRPDGVLEADDAGEGGLLRAQAIDRLARISALTLRAS